jgi:hypothetical protein
MKKLNLLFAIYFLFAFMLFANLVNAQVVVTDDITANTTWISGNEYLLDGLIFVDSTITLIIEAGTVVKAKESANITTGDGASALIIRRGAKLIANGDAQNPIIFTSEFDDINNPTDLVPSDNELWGGIILLGAATTNQPDNNTQIEGIPLTENARYGGTNDDDDSGILRYVSIRHGGFSISGVPGDEINGLTMGAIGRTTVIEHVEVFANKDDGYEWFGGTVNCKWLVAAFCADEAFDWDQGYRGFGQFWFGIQPDFEAGKGMEMDGGDDCETCMPYAEPTVVNLTLIGSGVGNTPGGDQNELALHLRDNSGGHFYSSIVTDFVADGIIIEDLASGEDSRQRLEDGDLTIEHIYWWNFGEPNVLDSIAKQDFVATYLAGTGTNFVVDPQLTSIGRNQNNTLDPRPTPTSPVLTGAMIPGDPFFSQVPYYGAFAPGITLWTDGWTALSQDNITTGVEESYTNTIPESFNLSQNFPNPFNPSTQINFELKESSQVKLFVHNILGQKVAELVNGFKNAGSYEIVFEAENLPTGMYIYTLEAADIKVSKKMTLLK